jgi:hypothetical protein
MLTMSISPFSARPASPEGESRRARLALAIAFLGISATLLAYAISPGVRHAVSHAAHSVKHAVGHVLDRDREKRARAKQPTAPSRSRRPSGAAGPGQQTQPAARR